jgi:hypothetical protein
MLQIIPHMSPESASKKLTVNETFLRPFTPRILLSSLFIFDHFPNVIVLESSPYIASNSLG